MIPTFHPRRGKGRKKRRKKKQNNNEYEEKTESFDWDTASSKNDENKQNPFEWGQKKVEDLGRQSENSNSTLNLFLVLVTDLSLPPGSGPGLIPWSCHARGGFLCET